ncbi:MAG: glycosyltransferase family 4 protein [Spirochaetales bacterium]|nr:glycosyltransferase family 4 protein [Spirochaetales bacterium]
MSNTGWSLFNFRKNLIEALVEKGNDVIAISPSDEYTSQLPVRHIPLDISRKGINPLGELKLVKQLKEIYLQEKVDVVLHFTTKPNVWGTIAASLIGKKKRPLVINNIAGLGIVFAKKGPVRLILENLYRFSQSRANKVFFQNPDDYGLFTTKGLVPKDKTAILPGSGVDLKRFPHVPLEKRKGSELSFIMSARLLKEKGVVQYVEAARSLKKEFPQLSFLLLGKVDPGNKTSVSQAELDSWVKEGIIEWISWSDNVSELLRRADCVVLPSFYREGTPRSLLEGMALGRPIITTDSPGCRETVDHGINGYMVEPRSTEALKKALRDFINLSEEERDSMAFASRKKAEEKYDENIVINCYISTILELEVNRNG